MSQNKAWTV